MGGSENKPVVRTYFKTGRMFWREWCSKTGMDEWDCVVSSVEFLFFAKKFFPNFCWISTLSFIVYLLSKKD